jgi:hypothetical protein
VGLQEYIEMMLELCIALIVNGYGENGVKKKDGNMKKVFCKNCKYYEYWNESIWYVPFLFTKKTLEVLQRDGCSKKLDTYAEPNGKKAYPRILNAINQCPYYKKGTPTKKQDMESQMYE